MFAELPVGIADPAARLDSLRAQMDGLKQSKQAVAGDVLTSLSGFAPPMLLALGARLAARSPSLGLQTGVTNVPGPQQPLHTLGRRLLESYPYVPVIGRLWGLAARTTAGHLPGRRELRSQRVPSRRRRDLPHLFHRGAGSGAVHGHLAPP